MYTRSIIERTLLVAIVNALGIAASFLLQITLSNSVSPYTYGEFVFFLTLINFGVLAFKGGLDLASNKHIPSYSKSNDIGLLYGYMNATIIFFLAIATLTYFLLFLSPLHKLIPPSITTYGALLLLATSALGILQIVGAFLQSFGLVTYSQIIQNVARPTFLALTVFTLTYFAVPLSLDVLLSAFISITCIFSLLALALTARTMPRISFLQSVGYFRARTWLRTSFSLGLVVFFNLILNQFDLLWIGIRLNPEDLAVYNVSLKISTIVGLPTVALGLVMAPVISKLWADGSISQIQRNVQLGGALAFFMAAFSSILLLAFSRDVLGMFGEEYLSGRPYLEILLIAKCINASGSLAGYLLTMTSFQGTAVRLMFFSAASCVTLNIVLVEHMGLTGAALANVLSAAIWISLLGIACIRRIHISPFFFFRVKGSNSR